MHLVSTFYMSERNSVAKNKHSDLLAADLPCTRTSLPWDTVSMAGGGGRILSEKHCIPFDAVRRARQVQGRQHGTQLQFYTDSKMNVGKYVKTQTQE